MLTFPAVHHHPVVVPTEVNGTCFGAYHVSSIAQNCTAYGLLLQSLVQRLLISGLAVH